MDVRWLQPPYIWGDCVDNLQFYLIQDLENVLNWLRANKRTLNMTKTKFMLIGSRQRLSTLKVSLTITIYDSQARQVTTAKSLGVTIENKLNWGSHIDKLTKKVPSGIGAIKRIWHLVSQATLLLTNQALIEPHFDYCKIVLYIFGKTAHNFPEIIKSSLNINVNCYANNNKNTKLFVCKTSRYKWLVKFQQAAEKLEVQKEIQDAFEARPRVKHLLRLTDRDEEEISTCLPSTNQAKVLRTLQFSLANVSYTCTTCTSSFPSLPLLAGANPLVLFVASHLLYRISVRTFTPLWLQPLHARRQTSVKRAAWKLSKWGYPCSIPVKAWTRMLVKLLLMEFPQELQQQWWIACQWETNHSHVSYYYYHYHYY